MKCGIVPRVAHGGASLAVGARRINFLKLRVNGTRFPTEPQRQVGDVHSKVTHDANLAACSRLTLPVNRLGGIEVARMHKTRANLDGSAKCSGAGRVGGARRAGEKA